MPDFNPVQTTVVNTPAATPPPAEPAPTPAPAAASPAPAPAPADGRTGATTSTPPSGEQGNGNTQQPEWARRRIDELTRARREAERERERLKTELESLRARAAAAPAPASATTPAAAPPSSVPSVEDVEAQVRQRLAAEAYDRRCNETYQRAVSSDPEFAGAYAQMLQDVGAPPAPILEAIIEGDDAVALLGHLARNYDDASRLFALSPVAMGRELERLSAKVRTTPKPPVVSQAPAPAQGGATGGGTSVAGSDDWAEMPLDEFMRKRNTSTRRKG